MIGFIGNAIQRFRTDVNQSVHVAHSGLGETGPRGVRRGTTLVEVMFAIGIVSVGLLGVLLVIPVAGSRTTRGIIADQADRVGRNAIRDFEIRSMRQPNTWTRLTPSPLGYAEFPTKPTIAVPNPPPGNATITSRSFCIDPLFIAAHHSDAVANSTTAHANTEFFPYYAMSDVNRETRMQRISLRNRPGGPTGMSVSQAVDVFMAADDLAFDVPPDSTLPPIQNFSENTTKRQSEGQFSWLATLTPLQDTLINGATLAQNTDLYLLSIVVFHRRDMSMAMKYTDAAYAPADDGPDNERLVEVASFDSAGHGGGEILLRTRPGQPAEDLAVRSGDWLMLSARVTAPSNPIHFFRWYRVVSADTGIDGTGPFTRNVTLQGTDWNLIAALPNTLTQATLMNNVVAVYEKTIRLETSSLWTVR